MSILTEKPDVDTPEIIPLRISAMVRVFERAHEWSVVSCGFAWETGGTTTARPDINRGLEARLGAMHQRTTDDEQLTTDLDSQPDELYDIKRTRQARRADDQGRKVLTIFRQM
jgi:hypothetical protein